MAYPGKEAVLGQVYALLVECRDCGNTHRFEIRELKQVGGNASTLISDVSGRLYCSDCRSEGMAGKRVSVTAIFISQRDRLKAEAYLINSREAHAREQRAKRASPRSGRT